MYHDMHTQGKKGLLRNW